MNLATTYNFFQDFQYDNIGFIYQGNFSDEITDQVLELIENNNAQNDFSKLKRRVSFLMVECFQNVVRYGDLADIKNTDLAKGFFMTRNLGNVYYITSSNLIENKRFASLKDKLVDVNTRDPDELKKLYIKVLDKDGHTEGGGAGLGLIEMARKSKQPIEFDFDAPYPPIGFPPLLDPL